MTCASSGVRILTLVSFLEIGIPCLVPLPYGLAWDPISSTCSTDGLDWTRRVCLSSEQIEYCIRSGCSVQYSKHLSPRMTAVSRTQIGLPLPLRITSHVRVSEQLLPSATGASAAQL